MDKKVCIMTTVHQPFDTRIHHKEIRSLTKAGYQVTLIAPGKESPKQKNFLLLPVKKEKSLIKRAFFVHPRVFLLALQSKSRVYHFHDPELIFMGLILKILGKKVIYDVHEDYEKAILSKPYLKPAFRKIISFFFSFFERNLSRFFDAIIAAGDDIEPKFRLINKKTVLVRNYPWKEDFKVPISEKKNEKTFQLIYIGSLTRARGIKEIVEVLDLLPEDVTLILAGRFYSEEFKKEVMSLPAFKKVNYLGQIPLKEAIPLLFSADVGLIPLHPEPNYLKALPTKLFEYMAAGLPQIVFDLPNCSKIIKEGGFGLVVEPGNLEELAQAVKTLKDHPEIRKEMGKKGREAFLKTYNFEKEEETLLKLYQELTNP
jgi:glycosyltransferase involved in cell wall biosynthesis